MRLRSLFSLEVSAPKRGFSWSLSSTLPAIALCCWLCAPHTKKENQAAIKNTWPGAQSELGMNTTLQHINKPAIPYRGPIIVGQRRIASFFFFHKLFYNRCSTTTQTRRQRTVVSDAQLINTISLTNDNDPRWGSLRCPPPPPPPPPSLTERGGGIRRTQRGVTVHFMIIGIYFLYFPPRRYQIPITTFHWTTTIFRHLPMLIPMCIPTYSYI